jgi:hypothetical protein
MRLLLVLALLCSCREKPLEILGDDTQADTQDSAPVPDVDGDGFNAEDDCDDSNGAIHPDADEVCDGLDNNCDGDVDEDSATDAATWYADADGDGYGDDNSASTACTQPAGATASGGDCDDTDPTFHPGAREDDCADPTDWNCDGSVGYADADGDGFAACEDCDDTKATVNDDAAETCNDTDDDCDGDIDENATDATTWYGDADGDTYGGSQFTATACVAPDGYVATADDCDDLDPTSYPGAAETCDEADNDCDSEVDEGVQSTWYADADGDGYGDSLSTVDSCDMPAGYSANGDDCDDNNAATNPSSYEICDNTDNDCDGSTDEDAINATTWYEDGDGDGYGTLSSTSISCDQATGFSANATDCDDSNAGVNPGATETCDSVDNDCDGSTDEGVTSIFYIDGDSDGYGGAAQAEACTQPSGYATASGDCDDAEAAANPGETEICDTIDNNCDGTVDEGLTSTWYQDGDGDGYGGSTSTQSCNQPTGWVADSTDCDDNDNLIHPTAPESCDGLDNDCDSQVDEGILGNALACSANNCLAVLQDQPGATSGTYHLDPSGNSAFASWCDMTTDGGGWTLAFTKNSIHNSGVYAGFAGSYQEVTQLTVHPDNASSDSTPRAGWLNLNDLVHTEIVLTAHFNGSETYRSNSIPASEIRIAWGQDGYLLYGGSTGYYWCGGNRNFTDHGSGQVNQPSGAPADCKGHGGLGSGWDFSDSTDYNLGLTMCGPDVGGWMHGSFHGPEIANGLVGAAQAIWVR